MVTAGNGALTLQGQSGRYYSYNFYSSDVIGASVTWNANGLAVAGSQSFVLIPENCRISDISFASTNTVSTNFVVQVNDVNIGSVIPIANAINTLSNRAIPNIPLGAGKKLTFVQA